VTTKKDGESLYWVVETMADDLQFEVAASHARRGNQVVIMTPRRLPTAQQLADDYGSMAAHRMSVISSKRQ
jgi:predicted short-subunit dehydrogenase-like oxidoreductase (DUF2520 family)